MRILVAEPLAAEGLTLLRALHEVDERVGLGPAELRALVPEYDGLVVRSQVQVDEELLAAGTRLVVVGRAGVGVDNVDVDAATRAGVTVVNAPTGNTIAAAEHTIALLLSLARRIAPADASVRRGEWKRSAFMGAEVRGRVLGIIGLGKIGQAVAARARGLEMTVVAADPVMTVEQAALHGVELLALEELLARADVVTLHVPLARTTRGLIGAAQLATMRRGAWLVNASRGGVVDEVALDEALRSGQIGGAAVDVFEHEPPTGSPVLESPNTVLTPHLGASTAEAQVRVSVEVAGQVLDVLAGRPARYAVNAPRLTPETAAAVAPYLGLAELLGQFLAQYAPGRLTGLTVEITGELAGHDPAPLVAAACKGLLETGAAARVTLVNAVSVARSRGIAIGDRRVAETGPFASTLTLVAETSDGRARIAGTVEGGEPRLVALDDLRIDAAPVASMLVTRHQDLPGTLGRLASMLGEADVNIAAMHLGRTRPREDALMILGLDDPVPEAVLGRIRAHPTVRACWVIRLTLPSR